MSFKCFLGPMGGGTSKNKIDSTRSSSLVYKPNNGSSATDEKTASYRRKTFSLAPEEENESSNGLSSRNMRAKHVECGDEFRKCWSTETCPEGDAFVIVGDPSSERCLCVGYGLYSKPGTSKGMPKTNQDSYACVYPFDENSKTFFAGVYDGHGMRGEIISKFVSDDLPKMVKKYMDRREKKGWTVEQALQKAHEDTDLNLKFEAQTQGWNIQAAGTTAVSILITDGKMYVCNVGDSRCVMAFKGTHGKLDADQCVRDHSPDDKEEQKRIEASGGVVSKFHNVGPTRIWLEGFENVKPGLAVTRSFGDLMAESVGVYAVPEIKCIDLIEEEAEMVMVMSDGVFEHVPNKEVVAFLSQSPAVTSGCEVLCNESAKRWEERIGHCDDITIVALHLKPAAKMSDVERSIHESKIKK